MGNKNIIYLFTLFSHLSLLAQTNNNSDYLVLNTCDTLFGKVEHIDERGVSPEYYKKIRFTDANGKRIKYKKEDVAAFQVNDINYEGFLLNQSSQKIVLVDPKYDIDSRNGEKYFLRVISKGELSHYYLEWYDQGDSALNWMDLFKRDEDSFFMRATQGLLGLKRKVLNNYFQDCYALQEQMLTKQINEVSEVVDFYNNHCAD